MLQRAVKYRDPVHCRPPYLGVGLVHVLDFLLVPLPQLLEQPWSIHADQPPLTGGLAATNRNKRIWATRSLNNIIHIAVILAYYNSVRIY